MTKTYFVSYSFVDNQGNNGVGDGDFSCEKLTKEALKVLKTGMMEKLNAKSLVFTTIYLLDEENDQDLERERK